MAFEVRHPWISDAKLRSTDSVQTGSYAATLEHAGIICHAHTSALLILITKQLRPGVVNNVSYHFHVHICTLVSQKSNY